MYMPTKKEWSFINSKFDGIYNFLMFFGDRIQFEEEQRQTRAINFDSTPYTSDGTITGIVIETKQNGDRLELEMIVDDYHRNLCLNEFYSSVVLDARDYVLRAQEGKCADFVNSFGYMKHKPFFVNIVDGVIVGFEPIDPTLYDKGLKLFKKIMDVKG